jgi:hypothetical protein
MFQMAVGCCCAAGATAGCVQHTGAHQHRAVPQDIPAGVRGVFCTAQLIAGWDGLQRLHGLLTARSCCVGGGV